MPNLFDGIKGVGQDILNRGTNAIRGAKIEYKNPFEDGEVGVKIQVGNNSVGIGLGTDGASISAGRTGVGEASVGISPRSGGVPLPGLTVKNAEGRAILTTDPIQLTRELIKSTHERLEAETNAAEAKAAGESIRFPQGQRRQQRQPQNPILPQGTPQTIPRFPNQGGGTSSVQPSTSSGGSLQPSTSSSGSLQPTRTNNGSSAISLTPAKPPFQIPTDIPKTNVRLPNKPQIGNGRQPNSVRTTGGVQQNKVNQRGGTIVRPEELEDIRANSPTNKPRINQPSKSEPQQAYRMLTPNEKSLFDCVQNGGGDACNKKYGETAKPSPSSGNDGGSGISLSLGDPYIGMGGGN